MTTFKHTRLTRRIEQQHGRGKPFERLLVDSVREKGLVKTATAWGVSKASVNYWMLKANVDMRRVPLLPGESIEIVRKP